MIQCNHIYYTFSQMFIYRSCHSILFSNIFKLTSLLYILNSSYLSPLAFLQNSQKSTINYGHCSSFEKTDFFFLSLFKTFWYLIATFLKPKGSDFKNTATSLWCIWPNFFLFNLSFGFCSPFEWKKIVKSL